MKLRTEVVQTCLHVNGGCLDFTDLSNGVLDKLEHDALAAHALMQAISECWNRPATAASSPAEITWIEQRSDELMRGWGFDHD